MGGAQSTNINQQITKSATNVIVSSLQQCASSLKQNQSVKVTGDNNTVKGVDQSQQGSLSVTCLGTASTILDVQSQITNAIIQSLKQNDVAVLSILGHDTATQKTTVQNEVVANFTQSNIQKCFMALAQDQTLEIDGSGNLVTNVTQSQALVACMNCVSNMLNQMTNTMSAVNKAQQTLTQTQINPLDSITGIFGGIANTIMAGAGIIVFIIILIIVFMFSGGSGESEPRIILLPMSSRP
jgi:hypothetical protein